MRRRARAASASWRLALRACWMGEAGQRQRAVGVANHVLPVNATGNQDALARADFMTGDRRPAGRRG